MLPNVQISQSNREKYQIPLDENVSSNGNSNDVPTILPSRLCDDIPEEERLSYVMQSLSASIKKSTLPEVNVVIF